MTNAELEALFSEWWESRFTHHLPHATELANYLSFASFVVGRHKLSVPPEVRSTFE
mgnify:CR=1 FL=1